MDLRQVRAARSRKMMAFCMHTLGVKNRAICAALSLLGLASFVRLGLAFWFKSNSAAIRVALAED